jgi:hypothetical protein
LNRNKRIPLLHLLTGGVLVFTCFILYRSCSSVTEDTRKPRPGQRTETIVPAAPRQTTPTGLVRPLYVDLPYLGRVNGARWLPGIKFPALRYNDRTDGDRPLDVLVDADGMFIAARNGGNKFDTRMSQQNMLLILQELMRPLSWASGMDRPAFTAAIKSIRPAKYRPDDPLFAHAVRLLLAGFPPGYAHDGTPQRGEETYCVLEVHFEGEATSRLIAMQRVTEGDARQGGPPYQRDERGEIIRSGFNWNNRNGCTVGYRCYIWTPEAEDARSGRYRYTRITEPWANGCPWPEDQLTEPFADNRLNELTVPDVISPSEVSVIEDSSKYDTFESWRNFHRARAEKAYLERVTGEGGR